MRLRRLRRPLRGVLLEHPDAYCERMAPRLRTPKTRGLIYSADAAAEHASSSAPTPIFAAMELGREGKPSVPLRRIDLGNRGEDKRFRFSGFAAALPVQSYDPLRVTRPSMIIVGACAIRAL